MARQQLEIRTPDGRAVRRRLSRRNPIVVGRNPVSDVHVDDESVGAIHCRVSWNGKSFEVAAVAGGGVDVNGVLVRRKELTVGDVIRVGEVDLVMLNGSGETAQAAASPAVSEKAKPRRPEPEPEDAPADLADDEWTSLSAGEVEMPVMEPLPPTPVRESPPEQAEPFEPDDEPVVLDEPSTPVPAKKANDSPPAAAANEPRPARPWGRVVPAKRPGEQDVLTSPLVLGFGGLALFLLLAAGAIWLLIGREGADRLYDAAVSDREAGRFAQSIRNYEQFLLEYPGDRRSLGARYALGLTRIERYVVGSSPDFTRALAGFDEFERGNRDAPQFDSQRESLRNLARQIAAGASAAATRTGDRKLLAPAEEGRRLFDRYVPSDGSAEPIRKRLAADFAAAEAAVRKREYLDAAAAKIDAAIAKSDFGSAFGTHFDLLTRYPDLRNDRRVGTLLGKTLDAERKHVREVDRPAVAAGPSANLAATAESALTLVGHTQARAGQVSDGRLVFAVARNALVGLDAVTGRPQWRSPIGLDTPFFPVDVDASVPALLAFDATRSDLVLLRRATGEPLWRSLVGAAANGPPLVGQGQIDLATVDGRLVRFDLESGAPLTAVSFSQPVVGPPVLTGDSERLVVFGDLATAYTLNLRTLAVQAVSFTGHAAGSLDVPPQAIGRLVVICENDRLESAAVRAFAIDEETGSLRQVAAERVDGQIRQPPVARGNLLFVPSSSERITAFSVSDDPGQPPMTRLAGIQIPDAKDVPTYLVPGPDGSLWAAGSALRKLRLAADGLELLPGALAQGRHTQPPQESGESLFVARSLASAAAIYVSQADREAMTGSWRTVVGATPVAFAAQENNATVVTEAGQAAVVSRNDLGEAAFVNTAPLPQWDEDSPEPLRGTSLDAERAVVWRGGKVPLLWIVTAGGTPATPRRLTAPLQSAPIALEGGLVLPLPEGLGWFSASGGGQPVEAFRLPVGGDQSSTPQWRSLVRLDDERLAALDDRGTLRVVRLRPEPLPHLAEVASITFDAPLSRPLAAAGERVVAVLADRVQLLDPAGLRPVAEAVLGGITGGPWSAGETVFVEAGAGQLVSLDGQTLEERWRQTLDAPCAGTPARSADGWVVASQAGLVLDVADDGRERRRLILNEPISGLGMIGETVVALTLDGSLLPTTANGEGHKDAEPEPVSGQKDPVPAGPRPEAGR